MTEPSGVWNRVRLVRASDEIVQQFRKALFEGKLKPGQTIGSEADLAIQFGVSRISVRDALRTLEASGIVEIRVGARGGARVAQGDPDRFADALAVQLKLVGVTAMEAMDAQLGIEWVAAQLAATHAGAEDKRELTRLVAESEELLDAPGPFVESSMAFHDAIAAASHNRAIIASLKAIREVLKEMHTQRTTRERAQRVLRFHQFIHDAITAGDAEKAGQLMRQHVGMTRARSGMDDQGARDHCA